jgi:integrase
VAKVAARAAEQLAGFPADLRPHDLRRTAISVWLAIGRDVPRVMAAAGHADPKVTLTVYAKTLRLTEAERAELRALVDGTAMPAPPPRARRAQIAA